MVKTMEWQGQSLLLLDQTKLPSEIITILCNVWKYEEHLLLVRLRPLEWY